MMVSVQGMSFLAGVLLLNMEAADAFISLANLLNRSSYMAFFRVDHDLMRPYFATFTLLLDEHLPRIHQHFAQMEFSPEYYLIEWSACVCVCAYMCMYFIYCVFNAGYSQCIRVHSHWTWLAECGTYFVETVTRFSSEQL